MTILGNFERTVIDFELRKETKGCNSRNMSNNDCHRAIFPNTLLYIIPQKQYHWPTELEEEIQNSIYNVELAYKLQVTTVLKTAKKIYACVGVNKITNNFTVRN